MGILLVLLLVLGGVFCLWMEIFLLPGFGLAGLVGIACLVSAVFFSYAYLALIYPMAGHITLGISFLLLSGSVYAFFRHRMVEKMSLDTTIDSQVSLAKPGKHLANLKDEESKNRKENIRENVTSADNNRQA